MVFSVQGVYRHIWPTFTPKTKRNWEQSVYYWWWKYLLLNEEYELYCKAAKKPKAAFRKIYRDFGDVFSITFEDWWHQRLSSGNERGFELFAEIFEAPPLGWVMEYEWIRPEHFEAGKDRLYMCIPLHGVSKHELRAEFEEMISGISGQRGKRTKKKVEVKYKVLGRPKVDGLQVHHKVYIFVRENPDIPLWKVAQILRLFHLEHYLRPMPDVQARNIMSATVSRHLKKARALIHNVGLGRFPDYTSAPPRAKVTSSSGRF